MNKIKNGLFTGERALYGIKDTIIEDSVFQDGESPLKETHNLVLNNVTFAYKYPLWYSNHISVNNATFQEMSRSGIWYTEDISIRNSLIIAPKLFRRCENVNLLNCELPNALETLWNSKNANFYDCYVKGDYFGLNLVGGKFVNLKIDGNYCFDGASNIVIENSLLNSKDSLWNTKNILIKNSKIVGEYLGWNSENVTLIDCEIESNQGFCYMNGLTLINCKLNNTDLAFEFVSDLNAEITTKIISVKNPINGTITSKGIEKLILDETLVNKDEVKIDEI